MNILAQNEKYIVWNEYEATYLTLKEENRKILIGDFYGEPACAVIDREDRCCVVGGCGIIIYYLKEPYSPYRYHCVTGQWDEYYRDGSLWAENVQQIDCNNIQVTFENGMQELIPIKTDELPL